MKRYNVFLVRNDMDGSCFVADSKNDPMFFENFKNYSNSKYYTLISKIITVDEDDLESAVIELTNIADRDNITYIEKQKACVSVWARYDFNFKHLTIEEKENVVKDYINAYFNN